MDGCWWTKGVGQMKSNRQMFDKHWMELQRTLDGTTTDIEQNYDEGWMKLP